MADYKTMYQKLFLEMNDTIDRFKTKLLEVEDIYIDSDEKTKVTLIGNEYKRENPEDKV